MIKFIYKYFFLLLAAISLFSCTDDELVDPSIGNIEEKDYTDPTLPDEIKEGYSVTFNMRLDPIGTVDGVGTRSTLNDVYEIDNYIDLEKVRILFFVCAKGTTDFDTNGMPNEIDANGNITTNGGPKQFYIGDKDYFLFESKSRWVSHLNTSESSSANWQVTAPVFTYGNNEVYKWENIRKVLQTYPFKVVIMVNRPDKIDFGNFDNKFAGERVAFDTDRGPLWGPNDSWAKNLDSEGKNPDPRDIPTINDLHHCQWDAVYASKNNGDTDAGHPGPGVYTMIMKNPVSDDGRATLRKPADTKDADGKLTDPLANTDMMGALSSWTRNKLKQDGSGNETDADNSDKDANFYFHPDKVEQAIPMYGVQIFEPLTNWTKGTPFNLSYGDAGQDATYNRKNIHLLRSLVKLELKIPKRVIKNIDGKDTEIDITLKDVHLNYSNVMARCEPLDVATPPELLWRTHPECEWENIYEYGPIIFEDKGNGPNLPYFQQRMAWFYGAWRTWWHFNEDKDKGHGNGLEYGPRSTYFNISLNNEGKQGLWNKPYPRIYNPVIQRNAFVKLDDCEVSGEKDSHYYYVIYTGERNINDPSKFGRTNAYNKSESMAAYFYFRIAGDNDNIVYKIPISDCEHNDVFKANYTQTGVDWKDYIKEMAGDKKKNNWNWPLMRNHCYTFTVNSFGDFKDPGGLDVEVVSTEKRTAPDFFFK